MIEDTLKDHKLGDKPRFFLHDEMKAWLQENLDMRINTGVQRSIEFSLQTKLGLNNTLPTAFWINVDMTLAGELIARHRINLHLEEYEKSVKTLSNVCEQCMIQINYLQHHISDLEKRLVTLETK